MCGRYILKSQADELAAEFELDEAPVLEPRFNIAPTQEALIVIEPEGTERRMAQTAVWGFGAGQPGQKLMINARSETAADLPSFRRSFRRYRCLVPADGFYEWRGEGSVKRPYFAHLTDDGLMAFAGLWQPHPANSYGPPSFTILTTRANSLLARIHHRMPVILPKDQRAEWLGGARTSRASNPMFEPYPADAMAQRPVSRQVNNVRFDSPECLDSPLQQGLLTGLL